MFTKKYYSTIKRNKIGSFAEIWIDLETVIQSKVSRKEKNKYMLMYLCVCIESESRKMVQMSLLMGRNRDADKENGFVDTVQQGECGTN